MLCVCPLPQARLLRDRTDIREALARVVAVVSKRKQDDQCATIVWRTLPIVDMTQMLIG
jgi:hypothetical protein